MLEIWKKKLAVRLTIDFCLVQEMLSSVSIGFFLIKSGITFQFGLLAAFSPQW